MEGFDNIFGLKEEIETRIKNEANEIQKKEEEEGGNPEEILKTWDCVGSFENAKV